MICITLVAGVQAVIVVAEDASQFDQIIHLSTKCVFLTTYVAVVYNCILPCYLYDIIWLSWWLGSFIYIAAFLELVQICARLMSNAFAASQFQVLCVSFMCMLLL